LAVVGVEGQSQTTRPHTYQKPIWTSMTGGSSVLPLYPAPSHPRRHRRRISFARRALGLAAIATVVVLFYVRTHLRTQPHRLSRRHCGPCELALSNQWTFGRVHAPASQSHPPGRWHSRRRKCGCPPLRRRSGRWCLSETCPSARPGQRRLQG